MTTKQKLDPAQEITNELVALLEKGTMPWRPWKISGGGVPLRHTGEPYQGINAFLLGLRANVMGYTSPYWMTFKQCQALDACVRRGSRSSLVVHYGTGRKKDSETGSPDEGHDGDEERVTGTYRYLKSYRVFHVSQIDGLDPAWHPAPEGDPSEGPQPIPECQAFFEAIDANVVFGGDRACYIPSLDRIDMPELARFETAGLMYATWAHELAHWSKAPERLDRSFGVSSFGNESYAKEELVAEITSAALGQRMGFCADHIENHAAYLQSWLRVLRNDKSFLFKAAAHAQRAVDYLVAASEAGMKKETIREAA